MILFKFIFNRLPSVYKIAILPFDLKNFTRLTGSEIKNMRPIFRLMPFRPLFPCVPWSRGTNNITLK